MWKNKGNDNLKVTILSRDYDRSKATEEGVMFQLFDMITSDARCTSGIKSSIFFCKSGIHQGESFHQLVRLKFGEETSDMKHLEHRFVWCWRRMQKIVWTDSVKNEEVLHRVKEEREILHKKVKEN
jgi:hypothetical protein